MLTKHETDFISYWEKNRLVKKKVLRQIYVGLPLAVILVVAFLPTCFPDGMEGHRWSCSGKTLP